MSPSRDTSRRPYCSALRQAGFRRQDANRDPIVFLKRVGAIEVDVQLWKDGAHRASHWLVKDEAGRLKVMDTLPTDFRTVEEMLAAITHEFSRRGL